MIKALEAVQRYWVSFGILSLSRFWDLLRSCYSWYLVEYRYFFRIDWKLSQKFYFYCWCLVSINKKSLAFLSFVSSDYFEASRGFLNYVKQLIEHYPLQQPRHLFTSVMVIFFVKLAFICWFTYKLIHLVKANTLIICKPFN